MKKESLENMTYTRHMENKRNMETYLKSMFKSMAKQDIRDIVKTNTNIAKSY